MCGIIGIIGSHDVSERIFEGLKRLEYRGYDSAGIAVMQDGKIDCRRRQGNLSQLQSALGKPRDKQEGQQGDKRDDGRAMLGTIGIGHTRWATHGKANEVNAHPHHVGAVVLVHNGIIENFEPLRAECEKNGHRFAGETDSEVVACLVAQGIERGTAPYQAFQAVLDRLEGTFSLAIMVDSEPDCLFAACRGSPLAIGFGKEEMYLASDALGLGHLSETISYLEDGDRAILTQHGVDIVDAQGREMQRARHTIPTGTSLASKGGYKHFMHKEIHEQPVAISETLGRYIDFSSGAIRLPDLPFDPRSCRRIAFAACGTSCYAAHIARYWMERWAGLAASVDYASEFRYRSPVLDANTPLVVLSQSGETADTLAAVDYARKVGCPVIAIVNVEHSSIARRADVVLTTHAGPEISVASTKAFTTQLAILACLVIACGRQRGRLSATEESTLARSLIEVPSHMNRLLKREAELSPIAASLGKATGVFYIGRGTSYPLAREGALKLKEVSYIHAEAYAAGEMKHGPIALIEEGSVVIVLAPGNSLLKKLRSNIEEVITRGARVIVLSDAALGRGNFEMWEIPKIHEMLEPFLYALPVQLLAYYTALSRGTDVDQPRNLAKSVTVE